MNTIAVVSLLALSFQGAALLDADQFAAIIREKSSTLKSLSFVYEGGTTWVGPRNLIDDPDTYGEQFQGTFLYRGDGAAFYDLYSQPRNPAREVVRKKYSLLKGQSEEAKRLTASTLPLNPKRDVRTGRGSLGTLDKMDSPHDFFCIWDLAYTGDQLRSVHFIAEGWEEVIGRPCLKVRIDSYYNDPRREIDCKRYWIDIERNATVLKMEYIKDNKVTNRIEVLATLELKATDGGVYWLPVRGRHLMFVLGTTTYPSPIIERTMALVAGSIQLNPDLPDALFSVYRTSALPLPGELERIAKGADSVGLRQKFAEQKAPEPQKTDPVSIRKRIDDKLAEADAQSRELQASSPARQAWSGTVLAQLGLAVVGVGLLAGVAVWKRRGQ